VTHYRYYVPCTSRGCRLLLNWDRWKVELLVNLLVGQEAQAKKLRFTTSRLVAILKGADMGATVNEIRRKYSNSSVAYYKWKAKHR